MIYNKKLINRTVEGNGSIKVLERELNKKQNKFSNWKYSKQQEKVIMSITEEFDEKLCALEAD